MVDHLSFNKVVSSHILRFAVAMRGYTSLEQSPSVDLREPRYLNCFTFSTGSLLARMVMSSGTSPMVMSFAFLTFSLRSLCAPAGLTLSSSCCISIGDFAISVVSSA